MTHGLSQFPENIDTFDTHVDENGGISENIQADDINKIQDAIVALQMNTVNSSTIKEVLSDFIIDGSGNELQVVAGTGRQVVLGSGKALIGGRLFSNGSDANIAIDPSIVKTVSSEVKTTNGSGIITTSFSYLAKPDGSGVASTGDIVVRRVDNNNVIPVTVVDTVNGTVTTGTINTPVFVDYYYFTQRIDVISISSDGDVVITKGTETPSSAPPIAPTVPVGNLEIAELFLPINYTTIVTGNITDKRRIGKTLYDISQSNDSSNVISTPQNGSSTDGGKITLEGAGTNDDVVISNINSVLSLINDLITSMSISSNGANGLDLQPLGDKDVNIFRTKSYAVKVNKNTGEITIGNSKVYNQGNKELLYRELMFYNKYKDVSSVDANGIYKVVNYKRSDNTLFAKSTLSNADSNGNYQTEIIQFYEADGVTLVSTITCTRTYDTSGIVLTEVYS